MYLHRRFQSLTFLSTLISIKNHALQIDEENGFSFIS